MKFVVSVLQLEIIASKKNYIFRKKNLQIYYFGSAARDCHVRDLTFLSVKVCI